MHGAVASEAVLTLACLLCRIEIAHQFDGRGEAGESASGAGLCTTRPNACNCEYMPQHVRLSGACNVGPPDQSR